MEVLKEFDFESKSNITIAEIKQILNVETFELKRLTLKSGEKSEDYWHWESNGHFAVKIHPSLVEDIKLDNGLPLFLYKGFAIGRKVGKHTRFEIYQQSDVRTKIQKNNKNEISERQTFEHHRGSYAQEYLGYSDQLIDDAFDGDADNYWNID